MDLIEKMQKMKEKISELHVKKKSKKMDFTIIAGPCAVESKQQFEKTLEFLVPLGIKYVRGGAFKPRTKPNTFQGLGKKGLQIMRELADSYNVKIVSEIMSPTDSELFYDLVDIWQVGARNCQNYSLLKEISKYNTTVILKRGFCTTIEEWIYAGEYLAQGKANVIFAERGIRTFERYTRNTFDIDAIPFIKELSHLPVIADPSHAIGVAKYVEAASYAAIAIGADGLIIEAHTKPLEAKSDAKQTIDMPTLRRIVEKVKKLKAILDEEVS